MTDTAPHARIQTGNLENIDDERFDVLVIGGGPAGASAAYWAAHAGHSVLMVEKKVFPRDKTCGDGLTPRAVHQLEEMGLGPTLEKYHKYDGLRAVAHKQTMELHWPEHERFPSYGYVVKRSELDKFVAEHAVEAGARLLMGVEATAPVWDEKNPKKLRGATLVAKDGSRAEAYAKYVVIAEGANSRFGRALGAARNKKYPMGMAIRTYYESPLHAEPWIESALDLRDRNGNSLPGYGWIFPVGDGSINVGAGLLSTFKDWKNINTSELMVEFAHMVPDYWEIDPENPVQAPTGGRLPMGGSIHPKAGQNWITIGDSGGSVNPFNGEGIDYAYETARLGVGLITECLHSGSDYPLSRYPDLLREEYEDYFKVARLFAKVIGRPALMRELTRVGMQSTTLMSWVLSIMANLLREDRTRAPEAIYKAAAALARVLPEDLDDSKPEKSTPSELRAKIPPRSNS